VPSMANPSVPLQMISYVCAEMVSGLPEGSFSGRPAMELTGALVLLMASWNVAVRVIPLP
jgi:hypothetical protein